MKSFRKLVGPPSSKVSSMVFLFAILIIALLLSSITFLVTRKSSYEGFDASGTDISGMDLSGIMNTISPSVPPSTSTTKLPLITPNTNAINSLQKHLDTIQQISTKNMTGESNMTQNVLTQIATEATSASSDLSKIK